MLCLLCKEKEANQTGSHIFTHSLISNCINEPGKKGRNKELMFGLSVYEDENLFVGNEVLPDKILDVKGRELNEQEIKNNANNFVLDNVYCSDCEKLFAVIENEFSKNIINKVRNEKIYEFNTPENLLIRIYFYIQIWRASSFKWNDWYLLNKPFEEELRKIVLESCKDFKNVVSDELKDKILKIPIVINYLETPAEEGSSNIIVIPKKVNPYIIFICDFVLEFFDNIDHMPISGDFGNFYGLNDGLNEDEINFMEKIFIFRKITNKKRYEIINKFVRKDLVVEKLSWNLFKVKNL